MEEDKVRILELQKELMNEILTYQIRYGAGSVSWNVVVQFVKPGGDR